MMCVLRIFVHAAERNAVAALRDIRTGVGNSYRQFLHGLGRIHDHDVYTDFL